MVTWATVLELLGFVAILAGLYLVHPGLAIAAAGVMAVVWANLQPSERGGGKE